jgi:transcriptional regulator with XRE-family HTH domain
MIIGERLRAVREAKNLSQGDIQERTGLKRCYISRVENCHTIPAVETLEKLARALELPLYQLFYDGEEQSNLPLPTDRNGNPKVEWGNFGRHARLLNKLKVYLGRMSEGDRQTFLNLAKNLSKRNRTKVTAQKKH